MQPAKSIALRDASQKPIRTDGQKARNCLLEAAVDLFSRLGFAKASTRKIAAKAGVNIASISYYFGDKQGLYRAAYLEPLCKSDAGAALHKFKTLTLRQTLDFFYSDFLMPLKQGALVQQCMRLHYREMVEPAGLWAENLEHSIKPAQAAMAKALCHHLGLRKVDDEVHRLTFALSGLAFSYFVGRDIIDSTAPALINSSAAVDKTVQRLCDMGEAMVLAEKARRNRLAMSTGGGKKA